MDRSRQNTVTLKQMCDNGRDLGDGDRVGWLRSIVVLGQAD
ncbi:MAG: hypothetical protein NW220_14455 [Leptolyngbyaceae cyanobacterium bins.349]|nr:hypothetical protein [Leptolyngbyaceae cyanobacterium bins.349]